MTNQQKTILFWIGAVLGVVLIIFLLSATSRFSDTPASSTVIFTGQGKVLAAPDIARLNFSILTQAATSKAAQDSNSAKSHEVKDFLKAQGVDEKDIRTTGYNVYPQQTYPQYSAPKITGYQVMESYQVSIRNLDKASQIVDGVVSAGANQVDQLQYDIEDPEKLKDDARAKAIEDARQKGKALEDQIGIKLGKVVNFQENIAGGYPMMYKMGMPESAGYGGGGPSLPTGQNEIVVEVTITYQIK